MSKSLKLKNNNYWDTKGIVHKQKILNDVLEDKEEKWQTVWEGSLEEGNISTWIDFSKIRGIRFAWGDGRPNLICEVDLNHFMAKSNCILSSVVCASGLIQFYSKVIVLNDATSGNIAVSGRYQYAYFQNNLLVDTTNTGKPITRVQVRY